MPWTFLWNFLKLSVQSRNPSMLIWSHRSWLSWRGQSTIGAASRALLTGRIPVTEAEFQWRHSTRASPIWAERFSITTQNLWCRWSRLSAFSGILVSITFAHCHRFSHEIPPCIWHSRDIWRTWLVLPSDNQDPPSTCLGTQDRLGWSPTWRHQRILATMESRSHTLIGQTHTSVLLP